MEKKKINRQDILIFTCWIIYICSYLSRYSYNANQVAIMAFYDINKSTAGLVGTCFSIAYGIGQVITGLFCKKYNKRIVISLSLLISSILNIILFFRPDFGIYKYLWFINGLSLSTLWATLLLLLSEKLDTLHLKKAFVAMSTTVAIGTLLSYGTSSLFNISKNFHYSFLLGFIIALIAAISWFSFYKYFTNTNVVVAEEVKVEAKVEQTQSKKYLLGMLIVIAFFAMLSTFIKDGLTSWIPSILKENYGCSDSLSIILTIVLPILGAFGAMFCALLNKKIKNYLLICLILVGMGILAMTMVIIVMSIDINNVIAIILLLAGLGFITFLMYGINNVATSMAPLQLRAVFSSGLLAGLLNSVCYVGSGISNVGIGALEDNLNNWSLVFLIMLGIMLIIFIIGASYLIITYLIHKKTKEAK